MTERDVRPVAADRKVTGGTRSEWGSKVLADWMTVTRTVRTSPAAQRREHEVAARGEVRC